MTETERNKSDSTPEGKKMAENKETLINSKMAEQADNKLYDDIIHLPHHISSNHPQMSLLDRAAQFSPFAALTGFETVIEETARLTGEEAERRETESFTDA